MEKLKKWCQKPSNIAFAIASLILIPILMINLYIIYQANTNKDEVPSILQTVRKQRELYLRDKIAYLQEIFERIEDMGPAGLLELGQKKLLTIYSDGTFGWWVEGGFLEGDIEAGHPKLREILCSIYYPDGKYYPLFCNWVQAIWLGVLAWGLCNAWEKDVEDEVSVLILSVIGLTLFELLFEARARYLFTYGPIYIITAIYGIVVVYEKIIKSAYKSK